MLFYWYYKSSCAKKTHIYIHLSLYPLKTANKFEYMVLTEKENDELKWLVLDCLVINL